MPFLLALGSDLWACPPWHCYGPASGIYVNAMRAGCLLPVGLAFILIDPITKLFGLRAEHKAQKEVRNLALLNLAKNAEWEAKNKDLHNQSNKWPKVPDD